MDVKHQFKIDLTVPFPSKRLAVLAYDVLRVDAEPKRGGVFKELKVNDNVLIAHFSAELARQLRVAVNGFFDKLDLVTETVENFGEPVSDSYSYY